MIDPNGKWSFFQRTLIVGSDADLPDGQRALRCPVQLIYEHKTQKSLELYQHLSLESVENTYQNAVQSAELPSTLGFLPIPAKTPNADVGNHLTRFVSKRLQFAGGKR